MNVSVSHFVHNTLNKMLVFNYFFFVFFRPFMFSFLSLSFRVINVLVPILNGLAWLGLNPLCKCTSSNSSKTIAINMNWLCARAPALARPCLGHLHSLTLSAWMKFVSYVYLLAQKECKRNREKVLDGG